MLSPAVESRSSHEDHTFFVRDRSRFRRITGALLYSNGRRILLLLRDPSVRPRYLRLSMCVAAWLPCCSPTRHASVLPRASSWPLRNSLQSLPASGVALERRRSVSFLLLREISWLPCGTSSGGLFIVVVGRCNRVLRLRYEFPRWTSELD